MSDAPPRRRGRPPKIKKEVAPIAPVAVKNEAVESVPERAPSRLSSTEKYVDSEPGLPVYNTKSWRSWSHQCEACGKRFLEKKSLVDHNMIEHGRVPGEEEFVRCKFCEKDFMHDQALIHHMEKEHFKLPKPDDPKSTYGPNFIDTAPQLQELNKSLADEVADLLPKVQKLFPLDWKYRQLSSNSKMLCYLCDLPFTDPEEYKAHYLSKEHKKRSLTYRRENPAWMTSRQPVTYNCHTCDTSFTTAANVIRHMKTRTHLDNIRKPVVREPDSSENWWDSRLRQNMPPQAVAPPATSYMNCQDCGEAFRATADGWNSHVNSEVHRVGSAVRMQALGRARAEAEAHQCRMAAKIGQSADPSLGRLRENVLNTTQKLVDLAQDEMGIPEKEGIGLKENTNISKHHLDQVELETLANNLQFETARRSLINSPASSRGHSPRCAGTPSSSRSASRARRKSSAGEILSQTLEQLLMLPPAAQGPLTPPQAPPQLTPIPQSPPTLATGIETAHSSPAPPNVTASPNLVLPQKLHEVAADILRFNGPMQAALVQAMIGQGINQNELAIAMQIEMQKQMANLLAQTQASPTIPTQPPLLSPFVPNQVQVTPVKRKRVRKKKVKKEADSAENAPPVSVPNPSPTPDSSSPQVSAFGTPSSQPNTLDVLTAAAIQQQAIALRRPSKSPVETAQRLKREVLEEVHSQNSMNGIRISPSGKSGDAVRSRTASGEHRGTPVVNGMMTGEVDRNGLELKREFIGEAEVTGLGSEYWGSTGITDGQSFVDLTKPKQRRSRAKTKGDVDMAATQCNVNECPCCKHECHFCRQRYDDPVPGAKRHRNHEVKFRFIGINQEVYRACPKCVRSKNKIDCKVCHRGYDVQNCVYQRPHSCTYCISCKLLFQNKFAHRFHMRDFHPQEGTAERIRRKEERKILGNEHFKATGKGQPTKSKPKGSRRKSKSSAAEKTAQNSPAVRKASKTSSLENGELRYEPVASEHVGTSAPVPGLTNLDTSMLQFYETPPRTLPNGVESHTDTLLQNLGGQNSAFYATKRKPATSPVRSGPGSLTPVQLELTPYDMCGGFERDTNTVGMGAILDGGVPPRKRSKGIKREEVGNECIFDEGVLMDPFKKEYFCGGNGSMYMNNMSMDTVPHYGQSQQLYNSVNPNFNETNLVASSSMSRTEEWVERTLN